MEYNYKKLDIESYVQSLYNDGLQSSTKYTDTELLSIIHHIGIFRFKGYVKAFRKSLSNYSIDFIIDIHNLDREISLKFFKMTSQIEIKLKSIIIETVYSLTDNPFCYLLKCNYKQDFYIPFESIQDWTVKSHNTIKTKSEDYLHYRDYYLNTYDFSSNKSKYIGSDNNMVNVNHAANININFPPFHYYIENITLGSLINIASSLVINGNDVLKIVGKQFCFYNRTVFLNYLLRLKELRNRCAHNGRIFNRNYRGIKAIGIHQSFREVIYEHKLIDVYYSLVYMLNPNTNIKDNNELIKQFENDILVSSDSSLKGFIMNFLRKRQGKCASSDLP